MQTTFKDILERHATCSCDIAKIQLKLVLTFTTQSHDLTTLLITMWNKSSTCTCQHYAVGCLIEDKKSKSKKGHNCEKKIEMSPLIVWIALRIVNTYSRVSSKYLHNKRDITKCQSFCTMTTTTKMPRLYQYLRFSPKTAELKCKTDCCFPRFSSFSI